MIKTDVIVSFKFIFIALIIVTTGSAVAQEDGLQGGTISSQFEYVKSVSSNYQEYKVVRRAHLDRLESNINDSISSFQRQVAELKVQINEQQAAVDQLRGEITQTNQDLERAIAEKDSFTFLGTLVHKNLYNNLVWGAIILLALVLVISYFRFKRSHVVTAETKKRLDEIQEEYDQYRKNTLERERKLNRQLVDALNKK